MDESFKTGTGLADSLDLHIQDAAFVLDPKYGRDGELIPLLKLSGTATIDGVDKPLTETWPVGGGWQVADDGQKIVSAKNTKINSNTNYGKFIDAFVALDGATDLLDKIPGASGFNAQTWVGMTIHFEREKFPYDFVGQDGTRVKGDKSVLLPTEILGHEMGIQQEIPVTNKPSRTRKPKAAVVNEVPQEYYDLALKSDTFESFIDAAYALDLEGAEYEDHVADDSSMGFYASVEG